MIGRYAGPDLGEGFDPAAPLTPSGNLRRRQWLSRLTEAGATSAAVLAVAVLGIVVYTVVSRGIGAISFGFLTQAAPTGIGPEIAGTAFIVAMATAIAAPLGVLVALLLTEFSAARVAGPIKLTLDLMNGLPAIIIGLFVFELLVDHHQQSGLAAAVALAIIMLPLVARGSQEILLLVPGNRREAAEALGISRWRTVIGVILPSARGGIVTATLLAMARAAGETAPLILVNSVFDQNRYHFNPLEAVPNIPVAIFSLSEEGNPESLTRAWGAALVLVSLILFASLGARALLARSRSRITR